MPKSLVVLARASVLAGSALFLSCRDSIGPTPGRLTFPAPIQALFPGMQDTVLAYVGSRQVEPDEGEWTSSDPTVLEVHAGGVVVARSVGEATIRFRLDDRRADSLRISVVPAPAGRIVFAGYREFSEGGRSGGELWIMNPDGTGLREVWRARPPGPGEMPRGAGNPSFSPDGCSIVFQAAHPGQWTPGIYTLDLRTGVERPYTDRGSGAPVWSPDGKRIAFSGSTASGFEIFTADVETRELTLHTQLHATSVISSDFFPDSRSLVIAHGDSTSDLYRLDLEIGNLAPLFARSNVDESAPAVAANGQSVAFYGQSPSGGHDTGFIYVVGPDGVPRQVPPAVRTPPSRQAPDGIPATASYPSFSPDGQWLVFTWTRDRRLVTVERDGEAHETQNTLGELYVSRADGSFPVRLTHFANAFQPDWGPACPDVGPNP